MNRPQRHSTLLLSEVLYQTLAQTRAGARQHKVTVGEKLAEKIRELMDTAGIPVESRDTFAKWAVANLWDNYKKDCMDQRKVIENEIIALGLRFPNGTVKQHYSHTFRLPMDKISNVKLNGALERGLTLTVSEDGECTLEGVPSDPGDFTFLLTFDTVPDAGGSMIKIPIAFNPNPRDLWRDIPTPVDVPYYKPDSASEYLRVEAGPDGAPRKDIVAASQRGRSHAQEGKPRDDHFAISYNPETGWYVMAVADGAGSAKYSRKGSEVACKTVLDHCAALLSDESFEIAIREFNEDNNDITRPRLTSMVHNIIGKGAIKAHQAINDCSRANEGSLPKDFATTLMFAIAKKFDFGWFIASFWVGDGAIALLDREAGSVKLLGIPDEGEYSGQTRFLTMESIFRDKDVWTKRLKMTIVPDFTALVLMTDGVSDPMFETEYNLGNFDRWEEFYQKLINGFPDDEIGGVDLSDDNAEAEGQLMKWLDFWSPGNHDDRTIAILY